MFKSHLHDDDHDDHDDDDDDEEEEEEDEENDDVDVHQSPFEASSEPDHAGTGLCGHGRCSASAGPPKTSLDTWKPNDL